MSAIAGRVLIIPKGAYNANVTYNLLDAVFFNGSTYIAKDTTTGNPPSDTEHWQILAQGAQDAAAAVFFGTCITAGSSQNKEVSVEVADNFALKRGAIVGVKFTNTNTFVASAANHITLNVNSSGVYSIYFGADADPEGVNPVAFGETGFTNYYQFDGTYWTYVGRSGVQTAKQTPYDGTSSGLASDNVNDAIDEVLDYSEDIDAVIYATGAMNLLPNKASTVVQSGVTFTVNDDGSITLNGTATANDAIVICARANKDLMLDAGNYFVNTFANQDVTIDIGTGSSSDGSAGSYVALVSTAIKGTFSLQSKKSITCTISVKNGVTYNNVFVGPMISVVDATKFVPYAKTNRELTEEVLSERIVSISNSYPAGTTITNITNFSNVRSYELTIHHDSRIVGLMATDIRLQNVTANISFDMVNNIFKDIPPFRKITGISLGFTSGTRYLGNPAYINHDKESDTIHVGMFNYIGDIPNNWAELEIMG